ncbi:MAG: hypothetical protein QUV20_02300 [Oceanibaculum nanhaiense]|uniref:hypothetical protein n=1 Tax=Oceanibaculum nanhaiense TaxID=1909734 RepID=UPI0025A378F2|nr:hypothetical protein [Oceanibaculum nanhaiense]MDM7945139.1 hypothetical protein [Oceanibaculum nanhaiense]
MTPPSPQQERAVIVRTLAEALAVLDAAGEAGVAVTLLSPPGAAGTMGAGFWQALVAAAAEERPDARFAALLDCGPWPGFALAALRQGVKALVFTGNPETLARLRGIAERQGASILGQAPPALDPAAGRNKPADLRVWLAGERPANR